MTSAPTFTNASAPPSVGAAAVEQKKFTVEKASFEAAKKWAATKGFEFQTKDDQIWVIEYMRERGMIK